MRASRTLSIIVVFYVVLAFFFFLRQAFAAENYATSPHRATSTSHAIR